MYGLMMDAFRDSQGEQHITRDARHSGAVTTTRTSYGDPKYLASRCVIRANSSTPR
jgi:hypothetical protein